MKKKTPGGDQKAISRRDALHIGAAIGLGVVGCGGEDSADASGKGGGSSGGGAAGVGGGGAGGAGGVGGAGGTPGGGGTGAGAGTGGSGGASSCEDTGGKSAAELLAGIDTFVIVMMENRTFDHVLGSLKLVEGRAVDGLTGNEVNLDASGKSYAVHQMQNFTTPEDPPHGWDPSHAQFNGGKMTGFVTEYVKSGAADPSDTMGYYVRAQLPVTYGLADAFVVCDRWFASVMGPTFPNRYYLHLATSNGVKTNVPTTGKSIFDVLQAAGVTAKYYASGLPFVAAYGKLTGNGTLNDFFVDATAGTLPSVCFVDPTFTALTAGNDDHPPADMRDGQSFLASVYGALAQSPQWDKALLVIMYDEHGGHFDHVAPPTTVDERPEFQQLGFRVPGIVIGAQVREGCINSTELNHVSVIATLTRRFGLPPINARVEATNDLSSCIDPKLIDAPRPPVVLPPYNAGNASQRLEMPHAMKHGCCFENLVKIARQHYGHDFELQARRSMRAVYEYGRRLGVVRAS